MDFNGKILIAANLVLSLLISSFVLVWGKNVENKNTVLFMFMVLEFILVVLLFMYVFMKGKSYKR
ncbi:hypothetical protein [Asaccharospora irregularis]|uniref:Uncharacterized protein n=1 Tax=Asaccharospora irregularis DSM 2635 TaxID=1121321 RepID=A0A1M5SVD9_9FIRM|nr:hypothetical protein [Asaccharospora irregularis]SHH42484.1 hypothetical protein SAMN04488530_14711 [Asaccharospora irregularis DSM 2635]